ncbi:hypothetical protein BJY01DRAFT_42398 [Aspergillus pseudoustus]|uniref:Uncharacterized protein n=1 Tax=Aspergillus pseudoustus TaxID=1810923 RepID=A0ABR4JBX3_9EURO
MPETWTSKQPCRVENPLIKERGKLPLGILRLFYIAHLSGLGIRCLRVCELGEPISGPQGSGHQDNWGLRLSEYTKASNGGISCYYFEMTRVLVVRCVSGSVTKLVACLVQTFGTLSGISVCSLQALNEDLNKGTARSQVCAVHETKYMDPELLTPFFHSSPMSSVIPIFRLSPVVSYSREHLSL